MLIQHMLMQIGQTPALRAQLVQAGVIPLVLSFVIVASQSPLRPSLKANTRDISLSIDVLTGTRCYFEPLVSYFFRFSHFAQRLLHLAARAFRVAQPRAARPSAGRRTAGRRGVVCFERADVPGPSAASCCSRRVGQPHERSNERPASPGTHDGCFCAASDEFRRFSRSLVTLSCVRAR